MFHIKFSTNTLSILSFKVSLYFNNDRRLVLLAISMNPDCVPLFVFSSPYCRLGNIMTLLDFSTNIVVTIKHKSHLSEQLMSFNQSLKFFLFINFSFLDLSTLIVFFLLLLLQKRFLEKFLNLKFQC